MTEGTTGPAAGTPATATALCRSSRRYGGPAPARALAGLPPGSAVVGSNLSGMVFFKDGEFLNFSTPNKDFTMHLGGWVQWDNVWWNQTCGFERRSRSPRPAIKKPPSPHRTPAAA